MVEILTMPSIERSLTEKERRVMWRRLQRSRSPRWRGMLVAFLVLFLPFLILGLVCGGGRLNAGDLKVLGSYALVLIAIAGWVALEERYKHLKRCRELDQALEFDKVRETKIQSDRVWLYDEIEDEGPV